MTEKKMINMLKTRGLDFVKQGECTTYFITSLGLITFNSVKEAFLTFCEEEKK